MPRRDPFAEDHYYHVYNRGAARGPVFFTPANYEHCLRLVKRYHPRYGAAVIAYCLMPNHYHFLLRQETERPLSDFIRVVFNAYVQAVNVQEARLGTLFEGRFRHVWVDREEYITHLCRISILSRPGSSGVQRSGPTPTIWSGPVVAGEH
jgi:REP element-mobilizing transposase RayT